jgi:HMG-box domain
MFILLLRNAFMMFVKDFKKKMENKGHILNDLQKVAELAGPHWEKLDDVSKAKYKQMCSAAGSQLSHEKRNCKGELISEVQIKSEEATERNKQRLEEIKQLLQAANNEGGNCRSNFPRREVLKDFFFSPRLVGFPFFRCLHVLRLATQYLPSRTCNFKIQLEGRSHRPSSASNQPRRPSARIETRSSRKSPKISQIFDATRLRRREQLHVNA